MHKSLVNLSLKLDPDNRTDHYGNVNVAAKRQIKYKQNLQQFRTPAGGWGGLTEGVNIYAGGGVDWAGRAVSQKTRAKQICDLELREQPLRRD